MKSLFYEWIDLMYKSLFILLIIEYFSFLQNIILIFLNVLKHLKLFSDYFSFKLIAHNFTSTHLN